MIDSGPSLRAATGLPAAVLMAYLRSTGWTARPSRVPGVTIFSKALPGADEPIQLILPDGADFEDEHRRVADALRTVEAVEERPMLEIVEDARRTAARGDEGRRDGALPVGARRAERT